MLVFGLGIWPEWWSSIKKYAGSHGDIAVRLSPQCLKTHEHRLIIPISLSDMYLCNRAGVDALCSSTDTINLLHDKVFFYDWMVRNNLGQYIPTLYQAHGISREEIQYPCFVKSSDKWGGHGAKVVYHATELSENAEIVQEFIREDTESSVHLFVDKGQIIHSRIFTICKGPEHIQCGALKGYTVNRTPQCIMDILCRVFSALEYHGLACADIKIRDGHPYILEINPRLGGSLVYNLSVFTEFMDRIKQHYAPKK